MTPLFNTRILTILKDRLLIEVSQQDEEHQGRAKSKRKMLEMEKNNRFIFFLLVG